MYLVNVSHKRLNLEQFPPPPFFHDIYLLKKLGHLFCRIFRILFLDDCILVRFCTSCKLLHLDVVLSNTLAELIAMFCICAFQYGSR